MVPRHALIQTTTAGFHIHSSHCCEWVHNRLRGGGGEDDMDSARTMVEGNNSSRAAKGKSTVTTVWQLLGRVRWWAALTLQREWVRWRGELMSLGVDDRSPSSAEASEMMEGWREWHGLTRTAATKRGEREKRRGLFLSWVFGCTRSREQGQKKKSVFFKITPRCF